MSVSIRVRVRLQCTDEHAMGRGFEKEHSDGQRIERACVLESRPEMHTSVVHAQMNLEHTPNI